MSRIVARLHPLFKKKNDIWFCARTLFISVKMRFSIYSNIWILLLIQHCLLSSCFRWCTVTALPIEGSHHMFLKQTVSPWDDRLPRSVRTFPLSSFLNCISFTLEEVLPRRWFLFCTSSIFQHSHFLSVDCIWLGSSSLMPCGLELHKQLRIQSSSFYFFGLCA